MAGQGPTWTAFLGGSQLINLKRAVIGGHDRLLAIVRDIDQRKRAETALEEHEQRLKDIINFLPDPTLVINLEGQVIAWNRAMEEMTGIKAVDILGRGSYEYSLPFYGARRPMLVDLVIKPDQEVEKSYVNLKRENGALVAESDSMVINTGGGKRHAYIWAKATPLYDSQGKIVGAIETFRDITERREMENRLRYLNLHDSLTGLYNRAYFEEEMRRLDDGRHHPVGLMVCDLDGLKLVNDSLGHDAGDAILTAAARVLKSCFRESDVVARIGGDEFAILLPNCPLSTVESAYQRIREAIARYNSSQTELHLSISVGYAVSNDSSTTMTDLYKEADNNMYREKLHSRRSARSTLVRTLMKEFLDKWEIGSG